VEDKVDFAYQLFEKPVAVDTVFQPNEMIDAIAITKGRGTEGVVTRWGVSRLPRKTHRGLRKARRPPSPAMPPCAAFLCFSPACEAACPRHDRHMCVLAQ
jgi:ribosomal protein L3